MPADLAKQPNFREIGITAKARDGTPPPQLTAAGLRLYQGDKQLRIAFFQPQPITVGILIDNSGSMQPKIPLARGALTAFIRDLNPKDEVFVATFTDRPHILTALTTDHQLAINHLGEMRAYGRTALYDAIEEGAQAISSGCNKRKALLVITDGMDTASASNLTEAADRAKKLNVPIYSIGIGKPNRESPYFMSGPFFMSGMPQEDELDTEPLTVLAKDTGGEAFVVGLDDKGAALKQAVTAIASKIGNRYIVGFIGDGSTNQLRVEARNHKQLDFKIEQVK